MTKVEEVPVPPGSLALQVGFSDYVDAYRTRLDPNVIPNVDAFARAFMRSPPPFVTTLLHIRDAAVGWLGLKTSDQLLATEVAPHDLAAGDRIGIFGVIQRTDQELLLGENDKHLDFRVSLLVDHDSEGSFGIVSTVVRFNNAFGRAYFIPVKPFHRRIVPAMLRRATEIATTASA